MKTRAQVEQVVYAAIDELNRQNGSHVVKSPETRLFGADSYIDSIALVTLIVLVEGKVNEWLDIQITIADDRAMSCQHSPFRTVSTLIDYVLNLMSV